VNFGVVQHGLYHPSFQNSKWHYWYFCSRRSPQQANSVTATPIPLDAPNTARLLYENVYRNHGLPAEIISDRDPIFMSHFWKSLFSILRVRLCPSSANRSETDGRTEAVNRKIEEMLRCYVNEHQSD
jgi:hypothetical protein